jgi:outer membrane protein assembly factor BamB
VWSAEADDDYYSSATVANGLVYAANEDNNLYAYDALTGDLVWTWTAGEGPETGSTGIYGSPTYANGVVYTGANDDEFHALDAVTGVELWSFLTGQCVESAPTVVNGMLFGGSDDHVFYAFDLPAMGRRDRQEQVARRAPAIDASPGDGTRSGSGLPPAVPDNATAGCGR